MSEDTWRRFSYAVIPGAGGVGLTWESVAEQLRASVLPIPDADSVSGMAAILGPQLEALPRPRIVIAASVGAMVALEAARGVHIDGFVLTAAGFGINVSEKLVAWIERNPPGLHEKLARICLAEPDRDAGRLELLTKDYDACGSDRHVRQLKAVSGFSPSALTCPPPTAVLWGENDSAIPLEAHLELARRLGGAVVPVIGAAHVPHLEKPEVTVAWAKRVAAMADWDVRGPIENV